MFNTQKIKKMNETVNCNKSEIHDLIFHMSKIFDIVRLVDLISMTAYTIVDDKIISEPYKCENCIAIKCYLQHKKYTKFEFVGYSFDECKWFQ